MMQRLAGIFAAATTAVCLLSFAKGDVFLSKPLDIGASLNQTVVLPCELSGTREYLRLWYRDSTVLFVEEKGIFKRDHFKLDKGSLVVTVVGPEAAGTFICRVTDEQESSLVHHIKLLGPPKIDLDVSDITVSEGSSLDLACRSSAAPKPTISYTKDGVDLSQYVSEDGELRIDNVTRQHAGVYTCTASNGYKPDDVRTVTVHYQGRPEVSISSEWNQLGSPLNRSVDITCSAISEQPVTFSWRHGDVDELAPSDHVRIESGDGQSRLHVALVDSNLFGNYTCAARNDHGEATATVEVSSLPSRPTVFLVASDAKVQLTVSATSPYRVVSFVVNYQGPVGPGVQQEVVLNETNSSETDGQFMLRMEIDDLVSDTEYVGSVVAVSENEERSPPAAFTFRTAQTSVSAAAAQRHAYAQPPITAAVAVALVVVAMLRA